MGLEYSQIASLVSKALDQGYIISNEGILELTDSGKEKLDELSQRHYQIASTKWIVPEDESRVQKTDRFAIYLPDKDKIGCLKPRQID